MGTSNFQIRTMQREDLAIMIDWAAAEGWNPGLWDAECFYATDPGGFLIGLLGEGPIATISVVRYGQHFGFLGFYIVKPEYRGKGYGLQIWHAGLARLAGRTVGLDGVIAQQVNYKKSSFTLAYRNIRYQGIAENLAQSEKKTVALSEIPFERLLAYDRAFFPEERDDFLKAWITRPQTIALGMMQDQSLKGYGVLRRCRNGYKTNSEIRFEYYLRGSRFSYPDFVMKDHRDRIHIFEVKSVNKSNKQNIDKDEYEEKILALKRVLQTSV